ncbi:MAG: hypothetical protein NT167_26945 [Verrucomicrobia bacterium]|nr:hypothetical protein [Verrucomicrobiota bacterium]
MSQAIRAGERAWQVTKAVPVPIFHCSFRSGRNSGRSQGGGLAGCLPWRRGQAAGAGLAVAVGLNDHRR